MVAKDLLSIHAVVFLCVIQEVEVLTLYRAIVEDGPDLFSLHKVDVEASFR